MMKCKIFYLFVIKLTSLKIIPSQTTAAEWPYDSKITFPYSTYSPINVNSSTAEPLVAPPVEFTNALLDIVKIVNTGKAIEAFITRRNTTSSIRGGPFFKNIYRFYKVRLYWNNRKGRSCTSVDGHGEPLEVMLIYYKTEYGYFEKALFHRDGLAVISIRIRLQWQPNFFFYPSQRVLHKLKKPGRSAFIFSSVFYAWFNVIKQSHIYYTFPGSYVDLLTGQRYSSTIELVFEPVIAYISKKQFTIFQNLRNVFGTPLENVSPIFPAGSRPIRKGTGNCFLKYTLV